MFHPADENRGKVFEIIETQMRKEIEAAQLARLREQSQKKDEQPRAIEKPSIALANILS